MQDTLLSPITVALLRQNDQSRRGAQALEGVEVTLALHGVGPGIVVGFAVNEQKRCFHFIRVHKRRHVVVNLRGLPIAALFALKPKGRQGSVVGARARNAGCE